MRKLVLVGFAISITVFLLTYIATGVGVELDMMAYLKRFNNAPNLLDLLSEIRSNITNVSTAFNLVDFGKIRDLEDFFVQFGNFFKAVGEFFKSLFVIVVWLPIKLIWYLIQIIWAFIPIDSLKGV